MLIMGLHATQQGKMLNKLFIMHFNALKCIFFIDRPIITTNIIQKYQNQWAFAREFDWVGRGLASRKLIVPGAGIVNHYD